MYQFVVFPYVLPRLPAVGAMWKAAICLAATLLIAAVSHAWIETPLRHWARKKFTTRRSGEPMPAKICAAGTAAA